MNVKYRNKYSLLLFALIVLFSFSSCQKKDELKLDKSLEVTFNGNAQVEVGGPYVGVEFHHSSPMPQRISFYYPVANSIDLSTDYWKRGSTLVMTAGVRVGYGPKEWIGITPFEFNLTPYGVMYFKEDKSKGIKISYRFCKDKPAMVLTYEITNNGTETLPFEFYTHLETSLKTCHTYALKDRAWTEYDSSSSTIYTNFDDSETQHAQVFVANAGLTPDSYNTTGTLKNYPNDQDWWYRNYSSLPELMLKENNPGIPAAEFLYKKELSPGRSMKVIQIIGSSKQGEGRKIVSYLEENYEREIESYEKSVIDKVNESEFVTGDSVLDKSYKWAKAILTVNRHYIDGSIEPMPCPAEYNFYFTHDILVTDYAAVNFDLKRVKDDFTFIINHANKDYIIPHAYYWKDSTYTTEYATSDNWNNFWFIIVAGSYLKHSGDVEFLRRLYPYLSKCVSQTLTNKKQDNLMWEAHLDDSDLGDSYGPRAYMTSMAVKAIKEYVYISTILGKGNDELIKYENIAEEMKKALNDKLWSDKLRYLINYYADGKLDDHYYTGALIAPHFKLLDEERTDALVGSTFYRLFDPKIGIYSIYPMDLGKLKDFLKLKDNEAGNPFYYANGGIWANANAWFALALIADKKRDEALNFIKKTMTLDGIINSPNGQPAMYEYRIGDYADPAVYGKIDKPEFLWAAGWYIYDLYHLFGIDESSWNIILSPYLSSSLSNCTFTEEINGKKIKVNISGKGKFVTSIKYDGKGIPSLVVPEDYTGREIILTLGSGTSPYISSTNSILKDCSYDSGNKILKASLTGFSGHIDMTKITTPLLPRKIFINGKELKSNWALKKEDEFYQLSIKFVQERQNTEIEIVF